MTTSTDVVPLDLSVVVVVPGMLAQHVEGHDPEKDYLGAKWSRTSELLRHFTARKAAQADALRRQAEAGDAAYTAGRQATLAVYREAQAEQLLAEQGGLGARCVSPAAGASGKHLAIAVGAVGALTGPDTEARGLTAVPGGASSLQLQRRVQLAGLSGRSLAEQGGSSASRGGKGGCGVTWQDPGEQGGAGGVDGGGEVSRSGQASSRSTSARGVSGVDAVLLEGLLQSVLQRSQSVQLRLAESCALKEDESGGEAAGDGARGEGGMSGDEGAHAVTKRQQQHQDKEQRSHPLRPQHQERTRKGGISVSSSNNSSKDSSKDRCSSSHQGYVHPNGFSSHGRSDGSNVQSGRGHRPDRSPSDHRCHSAASAHRGGTASSGRRRLPDPGAVPCASAPDLVDASRAEELQDIAGGAGGTGTVRLEASAELRGAVDGCGTSDGAAAWAGASASSAPCAPLPCNCTCRCHTQHHNDPRVGDPEADTRATREAHHTEQQHHADSAGRSPRTAFSARAASPRRSLPLWAPARPHSRSFCHSPEPVTQAPSPSWAARAAAARRASGINSTAASLGCTPTREAEDGMARACSLPAPCKGPTAGWRCSQSPPPGPLSAGSAFPAGPGPSGGSQAATPQPESPGAQEQLRCSSSGVEARQQPDSSLVADGCSPMRSRGAIRARAGAGGGAGASPAAGGGAAEVQAGSLLPRIGSSADAPCVQQQQHQHLPRQTNSPSRGYASSGTARAVSPGRAMGKSAWARNSVPRELTFLRF